MDYKTWVINWFIENGDSSEQDIMNNLDTNYFINGFIDSFRFILLLAAIGQEFGIEFDNDKFQDQTFSTINGLIKAIEREKQ